MTNGTIELVCFDLGGVLVRLVRGWEHAVEVAGIAMPEQTMLEEGWGRHHELMTKLEVGQIDEGEYEQGLPGCFPGLACGDFLKAFDAWLLGVYPGVGEMVRDLRAAGRRTAVLSNTNARHWRVVLEDPAYRDLHEMDWLLASHLIGCRKPEVEAYRRVEGETGTAGDRILFFDDKAENVEAARVAGWHAEVIDPTREGVGQVREQLRRYHVL